MQDAAMLSWKRRLLAMAPERLQVIAWAIHCYHRKYRRWPQLLAPKTFNELVLWRKIVNRDPRIVQLSDKVLIKAHVGRILGDDWITPTLWSGPQLPALQHRDWPKPFVVKANNGSGRNVFVRTQEECNWAVIEELCQQWLSVPHGIEMGEWYYGRMVPQILVEPFISRDDSLPYDIKFWTFHGRVEVVHVVTDREHAEKHVFFDRDWNRIVASQGYSPEIRPLPRPASFGEMLRAAETLAADFSFVRVDFYELQGRPRFGEMTFFPGAGLNAISPPEFDHWLAQLWRGKPMAVPAKIATVAT